MLFCLLPDLIGDLLRALVRRCADDGNMPADQFTRSVAEQRFKAAVCVLKRTVASLDQGDTLCSICRDFALQAQVGISQFACRNVTPDGAAADDDAILVAYGGGIETHVDGAAILAAQFQVFGMDLAGFHEFLK